MKNKTLLIALLVAAVLAFALTLSTPQPTTGQARQNAFANVLDAGKGQPCMFTRLYFILNFGPNGDDGSAPNMPTIAQSRPFLPVQVNERGVVDGVLFVGPEDVAGTQFEGQHSIFLSGIKKGDGPGMWKFANICLKGDPTPQAPPEDEADALLFTDGN